MGTVGCGCGCGCGCGAGSPRHRSGRTVLGTGRRGEVPRWLRACGRHGGHTRRTADHPPAASPTSWGRRECDDRAWLVLGILAALTALQFLLAAAQVGLPVAQMGVVVRHGIRGPGLLVLEGLQ